VSTRGLLRRKRNSKSEQNTWRAELARENLPSSATLNLTNDPGCSLREKARGAHLSNRLPNQDPRSALRFLAWILVLAPAFLPWPRSLWDVDHALSRPDQHHNPQQHIRHQLGFSYCSPETARRSSQKKVRARLLSLSVQCQELSRFAKRPN
jgi:hypothetical protein